MDKSADILSMRDNSREGEPTHISKFIPQASANLGLTDLNPNVEPPKVDSDQEISY